MRISNRMKNMSSSLNQKNFIRDYSKSQKIKNRLMKYAVDESKVYLKSERYLGDDTKSVTSKSEGKSIVDKQRRSVASHYKKEDIMKNRVEGNLTRNKKFRPNTSVDVNKEEEGFFTTEPRKQKQRPVKRKIYL